MAAVDEDNEVDGDGATVDGATGDYGDDDDYGDGRWTTTTMATMMAADDKGNEVDGDGATGDGATGDGRQVTAQRATARPATARRR